MLSSESCEAAGYALSDLAGGKLEALASRLPYQSEDGQAREIPEPLSREFAGVLYSMMVREMQKAIPRDEESSVVTESVQGFLQMFLPKALAEARSDALSQYLRQQLIQHPGEQVNERA